MEGVNISDRQEQPVAAMRSISEPMVPGNHGPVVLDPHAKEIATAIIKHNAQQDNPSNIVINIAGTKHTHHFRRKHTLNDNYEGPRAGWKYWLYRTFIGKDAIADKHEKEHHPYLYFFKQELGRHLAEFIGAFFLVFFVTGIQINQDRNVGDQISNVDKGLASGFILIGLIFCFGHVSGAHFNPCVTLGFTLRGAFGIWETITYAIVQFAGAVSASAILYAIFGNEWGLGATIPRWSLSNGSSLAIEVVITFILITVILTTAQNVQIIGATSGIAVGATFGAIELFAWNFTGGSVNPWRSLAPTLISGIGWSTIWIYIAGPILGTLLAVIGQRIMLNGITRFETVAGGGHNRNSGETDENQGNKRVSDIKHD